ncbi:MAG: GntR family transcriptional regulator [Bacteroidales bacterium]|nr:GntR family transcriptional regulator [Bacteroidales bacterium]
MDFKESKPIYMQIVDKLCNQIIVKQFAEDQRIPSVREYASSIEVNPNTVVRSYEFLQNKNIIYNKRGIGYFVSIGAIEKIMEMRRDVFMTEQLPEFFDEIDMLKISISEIVDLYNNRQN